MRGSLASLALAACLALAPACGDGTVRHGAPSSDWIPARSLTEAQRIASQGQVSCQDPGRCPESVAMLTSATDDQVASCTAFLVAPDVLATNSHCIPQDLRRPGAACEDRVWAFFPRTPGRDEEQGACSQVIFASDNARIQRDADYAFIRLQKPVGRSALRVSHAGLQDQSLVQVARVNPSPFMSVPQGSIEVSSCRTYQGTLIAPDYSHDAAAVALVGECRTIHGNSGSPVLDGDGNVRAIVHATADNEDLRQILSQQRLALLEGGVATLGLVSNLACVRVPGQEDSALHPDCAGDLERMAKERQGKRNASMAAEAESEGLKRVARWTSEDPRNAGRIRWELGAFQGDSSLALQLGLVGASRANTRSYLIPKALCFESPDAWLGDYPAGFFEFGRKLTSKAVLRTRLPIWEGQAGFDQHLRVRHEVRDTWQSIGVRIEFDAWRLQQERVTQATILVTDGPLAGQTYSRDELKPCPN